MAEHISCDCKCKFNMTICNANQNWNNKYANVNAKIIANTKKVIDGNPSTCICENNRYLKRYCWYFRDEIVIAMDIISTKKQNTIATNVTSNASINFYSKNVRDCYILRKVLLVLLSATIM